MKKKTAFVLGGGGGRGALQVGALKALLEAGFQADMLVGASIGAANSAFLAIHGLSLAGIDQLTEVWRSAANENLLPANYLWLSVRSLFNRPSSHSIHRLREFMISHGITPELRFGDLKDVPLYMVATDLNNGCLNVFGSNPEDSVLEGVLASTALPPWATLIEMEDRLLLDGGALSNLPIETAVSLGATEIVALDLSDQRYTLTGPPFGPFLVKLIYSVQQRQIDLELALARSRGVPVFHLPLQGDHPVAIWEFHCAEELIEQGYEIARREIGAYRPPRQPGMFERLFGRRAEQSQK